ncbi:unannotated protein [freshwater metagenome]|uniref:Unannotated protein n=1 Tax=freshwater metagenome TaxID=449393 RepID=A0A6J7FSE7_9ZZZZ
MTLLAIPFGLVIGLIVGTVVGGGGAILAFVPVMALAAALTRRRACSEQAAEELPCPDVPLQALVIAVCVRQSTIENVTVRAEEAIPNALRSNASMRPSPLRSVTLAGASL